MNGGTFFRSYGRPSSINSLSSAAGAKLHAGELVRYVIQDAHAADKRQKVIAEPFLDPYNSGYDATKYLELLMAATEEVLGAVGHQDAMTLLSDM